MGRQSSEESEARFGTYVEGLTSVIGHAGRATPLKDYCSGLLAAEGRRSVEPLAAATAPAKVSVQHQKLLHFVANGKWSDERVLAKVQEMERSFTGWTAEEIRAIAAPMLIIVGDSDAVTLDHAVDFFRLRGGGVLADYVGLPASQLAILPATGHVGMVVERTAWIGMMTLPFLAAPMP